MQRALHLALALPIAFALAAAGCATNDADAKTPAAAPKTATPDNDQHASCVALMTRSRECTEVFIPALVDARASVDQPPGIADQVKADRDGVIAQARTEWATDSTDANIDEHCSAMLAHMTDEQKADVAPAKECLAKSECGEFVGCAMPIFSKHLGK